MTDLLAPVIVAGGIAGLLALIELITRLKFRPRRRGWYWWIGRIGVDVAVAGVAVVVAIGLAATNNDFAWAKGLGGWVLVGVAGPAILRSRIVTIGKGDGATEIGPATIYEPIRNFFESELDDAGAVEQTQWLNTKVLPHIRAKGITPATIRDWLSNYIDNLNRLDEVKKISERAAVAAIMADAQANDEQKSKALINKAVSLGGRRLVESLLASNP